MKHQFDLQYFAEENTDSVDESAVTEKASSEPKKTDNLKYSDKDLDEILSKKFAKWQEKKQKEVDEAKKLAEMDAAQRAEYERNKLQEELNKLKKKDALFEMTKTARKMLQDKGINASEDLLSVLVTTDADKTKAAIDSFSTAFSKAVEDAVKERLKGNPPHKGSGTPAKMTKDQIMDIKDPVERQRLINENRDLFGY